MPQYCCVPECTSRKGGFKFPMEPTLRKQWQLTIKRELKRGTLWSPKDHDRVCHDHFLATDIAPAGLLGERKHLKKGSVPSVFSFAPPKSTRRPPRKRNLLTPPETMSACPDVGNEVIIDDSIEPPVDLPLEDKQTCNTEVQCSLMTDNTHYSIERFIDKPLELAFYTGFDSYEHFMLFFTVLGPAARELDYKPVGLTPENQLLLTLIKLRQAKEDIELAFMFDISRQTAAQVFTTWLNFLYFQLKEINLWPSKETVLSSLPRSFKDQFSSTRVILDATETPIQRPGRVNDQSATFSQYKHKNTLKTMIGCTPRGLVSYISDTYAGSASDRQIIERSILLEDPSLFEAGDSIMADRGILVQDLFSTKDVKVNTPSMLLGKSQLEPEQVVNDRKIASKRIHIERVIGYGKTFKILKKDLSGYRVPFGNRIVFVIYAMSNFRRSIVNRLA